MRGWKTFAAVGAVALVAGTAVAHGGGRHRMDGHGMGRHGMMGMGGHGMGGHGMGGHGMGGHGMMGVGVARLDALKTELNLRPDQGAAWDTYASTLRDQAEARRKMHEGMHGGSVDHHAMHETMRAYNRQAASELAAAQKALYDALTPEQRGIADRHLARPVAANAPQRHHQH